MVQIFRVLEVEMDSSTGLCTGNIYLDGTKYTLDATTTNKFHQSIPAQAGGGKVRISVNSRQIIASSIDTIDPRAGTYSMDYGYSTANVQGFTGATIS
jgi:hypothetical protein